jgi:hypothetical protein
MRTKPEVITKPLSFKLFKLRIFLSLSILACLSVNAFSNPSLEIILPKQENTYREQASYFITLLKMSLDKTKGSSGGYIIKYYEDYMPEKRIVQSLKGGKLLNLAWMMTSEEREKDLLPVRIPLLKGLLGYRVFIINKEDQWIFSEIKTLGGLKGLVAGQGRDWPDTIILRSNGLKVNTAIRYESLFDMLERKRFDYFPRGINEPWSEIRQRPHQNFMVEEELLLRYKAPVYFFTGKDNKEIVDRIEKGLRIMINDGSFDEVFFNHSIIKDILRKGNIKKRKIFDIKNPLLTPDTPVDEKKLWYSP